MKKQNMSIDILSQSVLADTDGFVDLNSLINAGNMWRLQNGMASYQLGSFINGSYLPRYIAAASRCWGLPENCFLKSGGSGNKKWTKGHVSVVVLLAEQISPDFHAEVHKVFIEGKILENRVLGGEEFNRLNSLIVSHIPSPSGNDSGRLINAAKLIRAKCEVSCGDELVVTWNQESANYVAQKRRVELTAKLCLFLESGLIRDWEHFKELIK